VPARSSTFRLQTLPASIVTFDGIGTRGICGDRSKHKLRRTYGTAATWGSRSLTQWRWQWAETAGFYSWEWEGVVTISAVVDPLGFHGLALPCCLSAVLPKGPMGEGRGSVSLGHLEAVQVPDPCRELRPPCLSLVDIPSYGVVTEAVHLHASCPVPRG
jgi:hypothetical protein